jgi:uronate dehydrogenase
MKRVLITGSKGVIGTVLTRSLPYVITGLDLPENNVADYPALLEHCAGQDTLVHLAGEFKSENYRSGEINPQNFRLDLNVLKAAREAGVPRVILGSSVHADDFRAHRGPDPLTTDRVDPVPTSPYGAHKLFIEGLGRHFAAHEGLEVVAIRFGGVNAGDTVGIDPLLYLSHRDLVGCLRAAVESPLPAGGYVALYAVSDPSGQLHDTANPLGWRPVAATLRS